MSNTYHAYKKFVSTHPRSSQSPSKLECASAPVKMSGLTPAELRRIVIEIVG